jgi:hypothetical protein
VPELTYTLHVEREDEELLVINGLDLARGFIGVFSRVGGEGAMTWSA